MFCRCSPDQGGAREHTRDLGTHLASLGPGYNLVQGRAVARGTVVGLGCLVEVRGDQGDGRALEVPAGSPSDSGRGESRLGCSRRQLRWCFAREEIACGFGSCERSTPLRAAGILGYDKKYAVGSGGVRPFGNTGGSLHGQRGNTPWIGRQRP